MTSRQIIFVQIRKYQLTFGLIFCLFSSIQSQDLSLGINECDGNSPIGKAYVLNEANGEVLGYSNKQGRVILFSENIEWPLSLRIYKMSALDTSIVLSRGETSICLNPRSHQLSSFEVVSQKEDIAESFRQYLDKTTSILRDSDTTHYYSFQWECTMPDSNWSMGVKGGITIPFKAYSKSYSGAIGGKFCQMSIYVDSSFYNSEFLKVNNLNHLHSLFSNTDFLRKSFPYRKKIKDDMILKKFSDVDSVTFIYSTTLKSNWKQYVGYPLFDKDSILVRNVSEYLLIDSLGSQNSDFVYLKEYDRHDYEFIEDKLTISKIETRNKIRHESGIVFDVNFKANLISESNSSCQEVSIKKSFRRDDLDELKNVSGYEVIVE